MAGLRLHVLAAAALCAAVCSALEGGSLVTFQEDVPFVARIVYVDTSDPTKLSDKLQCAGAIVSTVHILTSARCFPKNSEYFKHPEQYVRVGVGEKGDLPEDLAVQSVQTHPKFHETRSFLGLNKRNNEKYDIAVVTLAQPVDFNSNVLHGRMGYRARPILVASERVPARTRFSVGGFTNQNLARAQMWLKDTDHCKENLAKSKMSQDAQDSMICGGPVYGLPCTDDAGSCAWVDSKDGPLLIGLYQRDEREGNKEFQCDPKWGTSFFVDVTDPEIKEFLVATGVY